MANELDELFGMVTSEADKTAMQEILNRNPVAKERAESQAALFAALATGDNASISAAQTRFAAANNQSDVARQQAEAATRAASTTAAASLDELTRMVSQQVNAAITSGGYLKKEEAEQLATARAEELFKSKSSEILANAAQTSDQIYQIRRSHEKEFGSELDTAKFTEYLNANAGKFTSLAAAHDSYMSEDRIQARIKKGIEEATNQRASTSSLPGTTLTAATNDSPLATMMRYNEKVTNPNGNGEERGAALDAAVKAWRQTASGGNTQAN